MLQMPLVLWSQSPFWRMLVDEEAAPARGEGDRSRAPVAHLHKGRLLLSSPARGKVFTQHRWGSPASPSLSPRRPVPWGPPNRPLSSLQGHLPSAILPSYKRRHFQASADSSAWVLIHFLRPERRKHGGGDSLELLLLQAPLWRTRPDPRDQGPTCRGSPSPTMQERVSLGTRRAVSLSLGR